MKHNFKRLYLMQAVYCTQLHNYGWKWLLMAIQFTWPNYIVESSHTSQSHLWSRISGVSLSLHLTICSHFLANPSSCPWPCGNQVPRCLLSLGHHCPAHHLARPLTQADLTCCWSVLVGIVVVPCYPSLCPWPCGNQVPRHLLSLGHHCPAHYSAQPLTQADLTCCRSVLVGIVVVPRYPSSCPWPCGNQVPRRPLSLGRHCPAHYSAQPLTQADLTRCRSVLVGNVAVPCYPSVCPGHRRFRRRCAIIAPSVRTLLLMYTA